MKILWATGNQLSVAVIVSIVVVFVGIFVALFLANMFSAKYKITFFVDDLDVAKTYVKYRTLVEIPEEMKGFTWYTDKECTQVFEPCKMGLHEFNLYTRTPNYQAKSTAVESDK